MKVLNFYRDKAETFKCTAQIEGARIEESFVRLCLEFEGGNNLYFNGNLRADGTITVQVPALKEIREEKGIAKLEIIADSVYFKPLETEFSLTEAIKVTIQDLEIEEKVMETAKPKVSIKFNDEPVKVLPKQTKPQPENDYDEDIDIQGIETTILDVSKEKPIKSEVQKLKDEEQNKETFLTFDNFFKKIKK